MRIEEYVRDYGELGDHVLILKYVHLLAGLLFPVNYVEISPYTVSGLGTNFIERRRIIHQWCTENLEKGFKLAYMTDFTALMCESLEDAVHFKLRWC